jgi:hypothetical protein
LEKLCDARKFSYLNGLVRLVSTDINIVNIDTEMNSNINGHGIETFIQLFNGSFKRITGRKVDNFAQLWFINTVGPVV